jgi:dUTP pyrophosphatase
MFGLVRNIFKNIILGILDEECPEIMFPDNQIIEIKRLFEDVKLPTRGSEYAAGIDLSAHSFSHIEDGDLVSTDEETITIHSGCRCLVKTGLTIVVPEGYYGRIAPRSGLALKNGIDVGAGVIDEDFRGEVGIVLFNFGSKPFEVKKGDRVAQLICERIVIPTIKEITKIPETKRDEKGFGSTGSH